MSHYGRPQAAADLGPLFAPRPTGDDLKREGLARLEAKHPTLVELCREAARRIARIKGRTTIDDVRDFMDDNGLVAPNKYFYGAVFNTPEWVCIGREKSRRESNHSHRNSVWALR